MGGIVSISKLLICFEDNKVCPMLAMCQYGLNQIFLVR